ncbi:hypothetical protein [Candidatus Binatus sp.]|jgi:hypothetical protein|uniref:hypothetical protein n=1 Tax=Candidatus Binatus sp. TaxID=2811406 RepID=UPI003CA1E81B
MRWIVASIVVVVLGVSAAIVIRVHELPPMLECANMNLAADGTLKNCRRATYLEYVRELEHVQLSPIYNCGADGLMHDENGLVLRGSIKSCDPQTGEFTLPNGDVAVPADKWVPPKVPEK